MGPARKHDADWQVGPIPAGRFRHDALRADRAYHRRDGQERESADQPRSNAVQAVASRGETGPANSHGAGSSTHEPTAGGPQSGTENFLRHTGRYATADD